MSHTKIKSPLTKGVAKVPVIMQMEALECGAACLAMIAAYYKKWIPLEKVRIDCGVSRDGSNARNILIAARSYGFSINGYRYSPEDLKKKAKFPCIIHWNFNHFVVLNGFRGNKAVLNDPARGTYSVSMEVFDESYTGVCLVPEPGEDFVPEGKPKSVLKFAFTRMKGAESAIVFSIVCSVIASLMGIILPGFSRVFLDRLLTYQNPEWFYPFLIALSVISGLSIIVTGVQALFANKLSAKLSVVGNMSFLWKVMHMPMAFFSQRMAGDIQSRQNTNAGIANQFVNIFAPILMDAAMMIFYLVVMIRYSLILAVIGVFSIFINILLSHVISRIRMNISRVRLRDEGKLAGATVSGIEMIETIKASGAENGFFAKWAGYQAGANRQRVKTVALEQSVEQIPALVTALTNTAVMMLGVYFAMEGSFTVGMIMAFQGFLAAFYAPASKIISAGRSITEMRTSMERIEDVMSYPDDVCYESENLLSENDSFEKLKGNVELRNVSFGYSPLAAPLIRNFNLSVRTGGKVAIVGGSGCGKSTITKLISGLYHPAEGEILFDGKPTREIDRSVFTGSIAVIDQDIILFEDTVANNIKMWDNSIEDFEMILAARDAQLHEDIMQREGGYRYRLSEGGKELSGGQRQRLEIARALAQDPTIIILDEATSALDAKTEYEVVKAIENRGITCIVVAHRLSTIRDCDEIIVLDKGEIVERGTHDELYAKGGKYTELVSND